MDVYRPDNRNNLVKVFENWLFDGKPPKPPRAASFRPPKKPNNGGGINHGVAESFRRYDLWFNTECGPQRAYLKNVQRSKVTGETIAYYELRYRGLNGLMCSRTYLYGIRHGIISQLRAYEPRFSR